MNRTMFVFILTFTFIVSGCSPQSEQILIQKNGEINQTIEQIISKNNEELIQAIQIGNGQAIIDKGTQRFKNFIAINKLNELLKEYGSVLGGTSYDEVVYYYIKGAKGQNLKELLGVEENTGIQIDLNVSGDEAIFSLLKTKADANETLVLFQYLPEDGYWRLESYTSSNYAIMGKTAQEYYNDAIVALQNDREISAFIYLLLSEGLINNMTILQYPNQEDILNEAQNLRQRIYSQLPLDLDGIANVVIFDFAFLVTNQQGVVPVIRYSTITSFMNMQDIKEEAYEANVAFEKVFPGLIKDFPVYLFQAYAEIPTSTGVSYETRFTVID